MKKISNKAFVNLVIEDAKHGDHALYCAYMYECSEDYVYQVLKKSAI